MFILFCAAVLDIHAQELKLPATIVMAAPGDGIDFDWPVITADRKGLYSRIYDAVFQTAGIQLIQLNRPNLRCKLMVTEGKADFYPGDVKGDSFSGYTFHTSRYAIWYTRGEAVMFKKRTIPKWDGIQSLKGKQLLYQLSHISALEKYRAELGPEIQNALNSQKAENALLMLINGRADVLLTSIELIQSAEARLKVKLSPEEYQIEYLGRNKYYPQFQNNERGRHLADIFDQGLLRLYRSGQLASWYQDPGANASRENIDPDLVLRVQKGNTP